MSNAVYITPDEMTLRIHYVSTEVIRNIISNPSKHDPVIVEQCLTEWTRRKEDGV